MRLTAKPRYLLLLHRGEKKSNTVTALLNSQAFERNKSMNQTFQHIGRYPDKNPSSEAGFTKIFLRNKLRNVINSMMIVRMFLCAIELNTFSNIFLRTSKFKECEIFLSFVLRNNRMNLKIFWEYKIFLIFFLS